MAAAEEFDYASFQETVPGPWATPVIWDTWAAPEETVEVDAEEEVFVPVLPITHTWAGRQFHFSDLTLNGADSNVALVVPGQSIDVSLNYRTSWNRGPDDYCPGYLIQSHSRALFLLSLGTPWPLSSAQSWLSQVCGPVVLRTRRGQKERQRRVLYGNCEVRHP